MNDSHLLQYPICSLMSSTARRKRTQLTLNLPMSGVTKCVSVQGSGRLETSVRSWEGPYGKRLMTRREIEAWRNE